MIIGDGIMLGAGGATASIFVTGLSETDTVTASNGSKTKTGVWTQKVNPAAHGLPDGYTELEYIESTGTQYIDTEYVPNESLDTTVTFEVKTTYKGTADLLSLYDSSSNLRIFAPIVYNYGFRACKNKDAHFLDGGSVNLNEKYKVRTILSDGSESVYVNDSSFISSSYSTSSTISKSLYLLKMNSADRGNEYNFSGKIYSCIIGDGTVIERNFIPAKRNSDGAVGLYDLVTNAFFGNSGTGEFIAGAEVPQTTDGFLIEKIKDYGTWTVTATDGTNTATKDVLVDVITEYEIEMSLSA